MLLGLAWSAQPAAAASLGDVIRSADLAGTWAVDCASPPGYLNAYDTFRETATGAEQTQDYGDDAPTDHNVILSASASNGQISLRIAEPNETFDIVLAKDGDRIRWWNSRGQELYVENGIRKSDGQPTAWYNRCRKPGG